MTAECINLRTVPTARCMSRIGNGGGDGSRAIKLGVSSRASPLKAVRRPRMITNIPSQQHHPVSITNTVVRSGRRINMRERDIKR